MLPPGLRPFRERQPAPAAFSLIEMLITLALMVILTALLWSRSSGNFQRSRKQLCEASLQKDYMALQLFANDHAGLLPSAPNATTAEEPLSQLVPTCTVDTSSFICPGSADKPLPSGESFAQRRISYAYYMGARLTNLSPLMSDRQVDTTAKAPGDAAFSGNGKPPAANHHKFGGNVLFTDGHVESTPPTLTFGLPLTNGPLTLRLLNPKP